MFSPNKIARDKVHWIENKEKNKADGPCSHDPTLFRNKVATIYAALGDVIGAPAGPESQGSVVHPSSTFGAGGLAFIAPVTLLGTEAKGSLPSLWQGRIQRVKRAGIVASK